MSKFIVFICILIIAPIIAGIYGVLHDQFTYSIAPEYFSKFKFIQFGLVNNDKLTTFPNPRIAVSIVGFLATWWMGIPIGILMAFVGLIHTDWQRMFNITMRSFIVIIFTAFLISLIGLAYGNLYLSNLPKKEFINWYLPPNLINFKAFIIVGTMHNFSYAGGIVGLAVGVIYNIRQKNKNKRPILSKTLRFKITSNS